MAPALLACLALLLSQDAGGSPFANGLVRSLELASTPGTWVQHFRLERSDARAGEPPLGLLRYVAGPTPEGAVRVELELQYLGDGLHVIHTEQASPGKRQLVFREVRERAGRTLFLEGPAGTGYTGYELGGPHVVRHELAGGELPLFLVESARLGLPLPARALVVDPLAAAGEQLELATRAGGEERAFEARRADGSLRWRVRVRGTELSEWRFQERGPVARAIAREEYESLRERNESARSAAREAAAKDPVRNAVARRSLSK